MSHSHNPHSKEFGFRLASSFSCTKKPPARISVAVEELQNMIWEGLELFQVWKPFITGSDRWVDLSHDACIARAVREEHHGGCR